MNCGRCKIQSVRIYVNCIYFGWDLPDTSVKMFFLKRKKSILLIHSVSYWWMSSFLLSPDGELAHYNAVSSAQISALKEGCLHHVWLKAAFPTWPGSWLAFVCQQMPISGPFSRTQLHWRNPSRSKTHTKRAQAQASPDPAAQDVGS